MIDYENRDGLSFGTVGRVMLSQKCLASYICDLVRSSVNLADWLRSGVCESVYEHV